MSAIFSVDPRMIIGPASILGGLYFLYVCVTDAQTLLKHWRQRNTAPQKQKSCLVNTGRRLRRLVCAWGWWGGHAQNQSYTSGPPNEVCQRPGPLV